LEIDKLKVGEIAARSDGRIVIERSVGDPPYVYLLRRNVKTLEDVRDGSPSWRTHVIVPLSLPLIEGYRHSFIPMWSPIGYELAEVIRCSDCLTKL
jgi:hypothetical protein